MEPPNFVYRGKILCNFAALKAHATFGFWHHRMPKILANEMGKNTDAMGSFGRLTRLEDLPSDAALRRDIKAAMKLSDTATPSRVKREATRGKRLATALAWLAEGKTSNWKYANC